MKEGKKWRTKKSSLNGVGYMTVVHVEQAHVGVSQIVDAPCIDILRNKLKKGIKTEFD